MVFLRSVTKDIQLVVDRSILSFSRKTHTLILKNDVTEPKTRLLLITS